MRADRVVLALGLLLISGVVIGCDDLSCSQGAGSAIPSLSSAGHVTTTTATSPATTGGPGESWTTTSFATTSTSTLSTTTTTLAPVELYKVEMRAWKNRYAGQVEASYAVISTMKNPLKPSQAEIQAAKDLDAALAGMVGDLEGITPPSELSSIHSDYLASLEELSDGAHELAGAMEDGAAFRIVAAMTDLAVAWNEGAAEREALEQALGFSLSSVD